MYRYYSTQRPFGPGTFQYKDGCEVVNFSRKQPCDEIDGRSAWGYIDYEEPLSNEEIYNYELKPAKEVTK